MAIGHSSRVFKLGTSSMCRSAQSQFTSKGIKMEEKTLHNSGISSARKNVKDIQVVGDGDMFKLLCKASSQSQGWMKSTKACQAGLGCIVQVTTQQRNPDGSYAVAEALTFVRNAKIVDDVNGGRKLVAW
jgi:hypothetical protein